MVERSLKDSKASDIRFDGDDSSPIRIFVAVDSHFALSDDAMNI